MATFLIRGKAAPDVNTPVRPPLVNHDVNEYSLWQRSPGDRNALIRLLTSVKFFGAGGQAPTKFWSTVRADLNEERYWQFKAPYNVALISGYISLGPRNERKVQLDEASLWVGKPTRSLLLEPILSKKPFATGQWLYEFDDASGWSWKAPRNRVLDATVAAPFKSGLWLDFLDESAIWTGEPGRSLLLQPILSAGGQPPTKAWRYDLNDEQYWQFKAPYNVSLTSTYISLGPLNERNVQLDDVANWQWQSPRNPSLLNVTPANPFRSGQWLELGDDPPVWTGQPGRSLLLQPILSTKPFPSKAWHYDLDDAANWWQPFRLRNRNLLDAEVFTPFVAGQQRYDHDVGETFWSWQAPIWLANYAGPPAPPASTSHPGWPRRRWEDIDDEIERQRPLSRAQWNKLKAAQKAAEEKAAKLERQNKHRQAEALARIAREAGRALLDAEAARVEDAVSLTALTTALNAAASAQRITSQIHTANMRLAAFKAYLADIEDEEETIVLLLS